MDDFKDSGVLITGGTAGLGLGLARAFANARANVVVTARHRPDPGNLPPTTHFIRSDVADESDVYRVAAEAQQLLGHVSVPVNNASRLGDVPLKMLLDTDSETLAEVIDTNLMGPFRLTKAVLPGMLLEKNGLIVIVSSDAAQSAYPEWGPYGASKAAADHLFSIWQEELRSHNIRFFALDPGDMNTAMHRDALPDADVGDLQNPSTVANKMVKFLSRAPANGRVRYDSASWQEIAGESP